MVTSQRRMHTIHDCMVMLCLWLSIKVYNNMCMYMTFQTCSSWNVNSNISLILPYSDNLDDVRECFEEDLDDSDCQYTDDIDDILSSDLLCSSSSSLRGYNRYGGFFRRYLSRDWASTTYSKYFFLLFFYSFLLLLWIVCLIIACEFVNFNIFL